MAAQNRFSENAKNKRGKRGVVRGSNIQSTTSNDNDYIWSSSIDISGQEKSSKTKEVIEGSLQSHFLFKDLADVVLQDAVESMRRLEVMPGDIIIKQGDEKVSISEFM